MADAVLNPERIDAGLYRSQAAGESVRPIGAAGESVRPIGEG